MKITKIATRIVNLPFESTITTAIHKMSSVGCVLLTIETDEGIEGQSYLFSLNVLFNSHVRGRSASRALLSN